MAAEVVQKAGLGAGDLAAVGRALQEVPAGQAGHDELRSSNEAGGRSDRNRDIIRGRSGITGQSAREDRGRGLVVVARRVGREIGQVRDDHVEVVRKAVEQAYKGDISVSDVSASIPDTGADQVANVGSDAIGA